jgi:NitT/TauT family transport system substrate-binding protein
MRTGHRIVEIAATMCIIASLVGTASAEPLRLRYSVWVGFGPLFVAKEKGFFADEGVDVELIELDDHTAAFAALYAGHVDALAAAMQEAVVFAEPDEEPLACVLALDDSQGGDGILATKDILTIADLEGRSVAYGDRGISQFYVNVLLKEVGLSQADIDFVDLPADKAAEALMLGEVDAAVTWEPYLTQGRSVAHGHLLADSSARPGLLGDCLMTQPSIFNARKAEFRALARAWDAAVRYVDEHPAEANAIIARSMGDWLADPAVVDEMLRGVAFYDAARNREYFGASEAPGQIYQTMQYAIDVWSDLGMLKVEVTPADVIAHGILED